MSELLTTKELAELTGYHKGSIVRLVREGKIPALRMPAGRKYMFEKDAVLKILRHKNGSNKKFDL